MLSNFRNKIVSVAISRFIERRWLHNCNVNLRSAKAPRELGESTTEVCKDHSTVNAMKSNVDRDNFVVKTIKKDTSKERDYHSTVENKAADEESENALNLKEFLRITAQTTEEKFLEKNILSYINVCEASGYLDHAINIVLSCLENGKVSIIFNEKQFTVNIRIMNELIKSLSRKGTTEQIDKVVSTLLKNTSLVPNCDTFALWFVCLAKHDLIGHQAKLAELLNAMKKQNITLENVCRHSTMTCGSSPSLLESIKEVDHELWLSVQQPECDMDLKSQAFQYSTDNRIVQDLNLELPKREPWSFMSKEELMAQIDKQFENEWNGSVTINWPKKESDKDTEKSIEDLWQEWRTSLKAKFTSQLQIYCEAFMDHNSTHIQLYPYLAALNAEDLTDITCKHVQALLMGYKHHRGHIRAVAQSIGEDIYLRYLNITTPDLAREKYKQIYKEYCMQLYSGESKYIPRVSWLKLLQEHGMELPGNAYNMADWPYDFKMSIGNICVDNILKCLKFRNEDTNGTFEFPAFYTTKQMDYDYKKVKIITPKRHVKTLFSNTTPQVYVSANSLPMLCPPVPWISHTKGSYLNSCSDLVRLPPLGKAQGHELDNSRANQLYPVIDSVNQMAYVPWKVNRSIFNLIKEVWLDGGDEELGVPTVPGKKPENKGIYRRMAQSYRRAAFKIAVADHYKDRTIWLPEFMDFRGRVYPIPSEINHVDEDVFRSLMVFAQGKPLGTRGLRWLKLHVINLSGLKKGCSMDEKLAYFDEIREDIFDAADNPFEGNRWWVLSDGPWQTLAACIEVTNALRSDKPREYVSHLPIHQDGSTNGLQHYAALGRDKEGAISVNMANSSSPKDIYAEVMNKTENRLLEDADKGIEIAVQLHGCVTRKLVKFAVLSSGFGLRPRRAQKEILKRLEDSKEHLPDSVCEEASSYLTDLIFASLGDMFANTRVIQNVLGECSDFTCKLGKTVSWITPMGLPILQPYPEQLSRSQFKNKDTWLEEIASKQRRSFLPNFIQSLDASHMMLTSLHCQRHCIDFASVHDCFWTHASTVDLMGKICREQFVNLHSEPILENLLTYFRKNIAPELPLEKFPQALLQVPQQGDFDIKNILNSTYFFS